MSKGSKNSTITNVQKLPEPIEAALTQAYTDFNPFQAAFQATSDFNPRAYDGPTMAPFSPLQQSAISNAEGLMQRPAYIDQMEQTLTGFAQGDTGIAFDDANLSRLANQVADASRLEGLFGSTDPAIAQLQGLSQQSTSLNPLTAQQNRENLATGLLGTMAMDGGTNPFLQQQLDSALSGAVDRATSQYALGGRLGSDSFAGALGAGISNAAAPILAANLQQDRANRLAASQALGNVSGQDLSREASLGQNIVGAGQTNLTNQVDATQALSRAFGQNFGQNTDIANNLLRAQQADLSRQLGASQSLASNQLDQTKSSAAMQLQAAQALPAILAAEQSRIGTLQDLGAMQQAPAQAALDAERARVSNQNVLDQNRVNALLGASGMGQGMFGTTSTQTGGGPSGLQSGLGGALAGASLINTLGPMGLGLTPAMGAIGGGALGLLASDNRLKEDVELLGKHPNGLNVYKWKWNKTAKRHHFEIYPTEGFMAQEAKKLYPEHVYRHPTGFLMLDYAALSNEVMGVI